MPEVYGSFIPHFRLQKFISGGSVSIISSSLKETRMWVESFLQASETGELSSELGKASHFIFTKASTRDRF
jgi:hypothetical protein